MMYFCRIMEITQIGRVIITDAAISPPQSTDAYDTKLKIAIGSVIVLLPLNTSENIKLFHEKINASSEAVRIPALQSGSTTLKKVRNFVQPSTHAAISSSIGIDSKNGVIIHTISGSATNIWLNIIDV